ncbi:MAG: valine--tRNA ligase, partial [Acidobacteria bacterium]|nr:valine--tRNA ligase [Acidobacteriota bacterium]
MTTPTEIPKVYPPHEIEGRWYPYWERNGFFRPEIQGRADAPVFSMVIPPPNVTGYLHMGHALNHTLQDLLARWRRMHGDRVLWLPGTDHAGIATQMVVERQLAEKGIRRQDLGREEFVARVWQWKEHSGGTMQKQMRILGESVDWSRERFTLDDGLSAAVREVFVQLYDQNLIYRGEYMINWSPGLQTAISDLEVEMKPVKGKLYHVAYPVEEAGGQGSVVSEDLKEAYESANEGERQRRSGLLRTGHGDFVVVVTTRPETMLGDTAVAFHPEDERYQELAGKQALLPLVGRRLPFIRDPVVEREFGTGLVKVTPAHDPNDFAMGRRHQLEFVTVIGKDARMTGAAPEKYRGLDRFEARKAVVAELEATGLLLKVEDYAHNVGHCQRSGTIVEPLVSTQWFVRMKPLAEPAIEAVRSGKTRFVPEHWAKVYFDWLERIEDWCISRQLWWGHRIPAWYDQEGRIVVARDEEEARARHLELTGDRSMGLRQDEDVLDTWFSSALWPFSTLGWPRPTEDLKTYYPTSVMITGPDIIFFWVARMMMTGLKFMGDVPFRKVYINSIVVDPEGKKMSKTKGNTVDPLDVFEKYGTDAVRFTLSAGASPGTNISLQPAKLETNRNFANKIWNASRFVLMNSEGARYNLQAFDRDDLAVYDRWILLRLHQTIASVDEALGEFRFHEAAATIYHFFWDEFCDWYI